MNEHAEFDQNRVLDSAEQISGPEISSFAQDRKNDFNFKGKKNRVNIKDNLVPIIGLSLFVVLMLSFVVYTNTRDRGPAKVVSSANGFVDVSEPASEPEESLTGDGTTVSVANSPNISEEKQIQGKKSDFVVGQSSTVSTSVSLNGVSHVAAEVATHDQHEQDVDSNAISTLVSRLDKAEEKISVVSTQWASIEVMSTEVAQLKSDMGELKLLIRQIQENQQRVADMKKNKHKSASVVAVKKQQAVLNAQARTSTNTDVVVKDQSVTKPSKLELTAVVQDQAWLTNDKGETISVNVANPVVKGYGKVVRFDSENFRICFDSGKCIGD